MLSFVLLVATICICKATDTEYLTSSLSHTYLKTKKWSLKASISMSVEDNLVTLTLVGPNSVWFSVGFGNKYMDGTYCVVVDGCGDVSERYLIGTTAGDELDFTWTVSSNVESSHYRTVVLTRDYDYELSSDYYHQFVTTYSKLETIWAYGTASDLDNHGNTRRGDQELKATRSTSQLDYEVDLEEEEEEKEEDEEEEEENEKESSGQLDKQLWGDRAVNAMEDDEYSAYLTTSSVITWMTCMIALMAFGWFIYQKWIKNNYSYNRIPDESPKSHAQSNINMVPMGNSHVAV